MPLILGTNSIKDTGFNVSNSLRFNDDDTAYMTSPTRGTATSQKKGTVSFWMKLSEIGQVRMLGTYENGNNEFQVKLTNDSQLEIYQIAGGSNNLSKKTNRVFRDPSAWMHIVIAIDCTLTAGSEDVVKLNVNGTRETSFATNTNNMPLNHSFHGFYQGLTQRIGADAGSTSHTYDGYFAEFVYIDGQQLDADSFGEFDSDSPNIWKPIDVSGLTFGNNGYYLQFKESGTSQNSSGLGADTSGNDNHFAVTNLAATDQSTDTCTNNFCTLNPLSFTEGTLSEGNLEIDQNGSAGRFCASTFQVTQGKWYYEAKILNYGSDPRPSLGVGRNEETYTGNAHQGASSIVYGLENAAVFKGNTSVFDHNSSPSSGDIYGVAFDIDNLKIYFHKNGTYFNSGDPANGTGNVTTLVSGTDYSPITGALNTNSNSVRNNDWQFNFGSPPYSVSSGNADANGYGNMEYSVPSGYYTLCTKNLAEYG